MIKQISQDASLKAYNSFGFEVSAEYLTVVTTLDELREALQFASSKKLPLLVIGGGSNLILMQDIRGLVVVNSIGLKQVTHDLRTPITTLQLRCEFLPEGEDKQKIQQGLKRMEQMLNATLQFAREDGLDEPIRNLDLPSLVQSLCDDLQDNGHDVSLEERDAILYRGRPTALRRALQNLLDNGVKYGDKVEVRLLDEPGQIRILIRDFGPGIPPDQLEEVFKPFTRLDSARDLTDGSIGLGLAIARTLIHQHGGELTLDNHPQGGLLVQVRLPH